MAAVAFVQATLFSSGRNSCYPDLFQDMTTNFITKCKVKKEMLKNVRIAGSFCVHVALQPASALHRPLDFIAADANLSCVFTWLSTLQLESEMQLFGSLLKGSGDIRDSANDPTGPVTQQ
jgi:hypothetical protein